jgi:hypothetical protein
MLQDFRRFSHRSLWSVLTSGIQRPKACHQLSHWYIARLILPWRWKRSSSDSRLPFNGLHGVISQNIILFFKCCFQRKKFDVLRLWMLSAIWTKQQVSFATETCRINWQAFFVSTAGHKNINSPFRHHTGCTLFVCAILEKLLCRRSPTSACVLAGPSRACARSMFMCSSRARM